GWSPASWFPVALVRGRRGRGRCAARTHRPWTLLLRPVLDRRPVPTNGNAGSVIHISWFPQPSRSSSTVDRMPGVVHPAVPPTSDDWSEREAPAGRIGAPGVGKALAQPFPPTRS